MSRKPTPNIDYTSRDYEAYRELLITKLQEKMPEYTDTTETDAGIVILEALANGLDIISLYSDIIANDVLLPTTQSRRLAVILANCLGYYPYNSTASEYPQVFILSEIQDNDTVIPKGTIVTTEDEDEDLEELYFETKEDLVIPAGALGDEQDAYGNYLYTVPVVAGETINQDVIGSSSGTPLQSFKTNYIDVLIDSLELFIDEGSGEELWSRVDSFFDSDENSKVYIAYVDEFDQCIIQFGNGVKGKIPLAFPNGIVANYRIGGGTASNVDAGDINVVDDSISFVEDTFNLSATVLGRDKETLESIKVNAPAAYRTRDRLVTSSDYKDLLKINFYDFYDIQAVRDNLNKKLIHLFYFMRSGYSFTPALSAKISDFIGAKAMIGTNYDINNHTSETINIAANMYYDPDYDVDELKADIASYLSSWTFNPENMQFDGVIIKSDLESEIKETFKGVKSFRITSPVADIISPSYPQNILKLGTVTITATAL